MSFKRTLSLVKVYPCQTRVMLGSPSSATSNNHVLLDQLTAASHPASSGARDDIRAKHCRERAAPSSTAASGLDLPTRSL